MLNDSIQTGIAFFALIVSIVSIIYTNKESRKNREISEENRKIAEESMKIGHANIESTIANDIRVAENRISDISLTLLEYKNSYEDKKSKGELNEKFEEMMKAKELHYKQAIESMLNVYEDACAKYRDNKIDRVRFKKSYSVTIRKIVENKEFSSYFDRVTSPYQAILRVYEEWNHLED